MASNKFNEYKRISEIERDIRDSLSTTVKIGHDQVLDIVVADLLAKYKGAIMRKSKWIEPFKTILRFYLEEHELDLLMSNEGE